MTTVLFLSNQSPTDLETLIEERLSRHHSLRKVHVEPGYLWMESIKDAIRASDVIILPITEAHSKSKNKKHELNYVLSYARESKDKLILPIVFGDIETPSDIRDFLYIGVAPNEADALERTVQTINNSISSYEGRRAAKEELKVKQTEKIELRASTYVEETIKELTRREEKLASTAKLWYGLGYAAILLGAIAACVFAFAGYNNLEASKSNWDIVAFASIKSLILVGLLLALARYSFNLAKSYMDESLKNADRIHAISFGKFFLQAFSEQASAENIKDIFQHWNTRGSNSFATSTPDLIEPKVFELASELAKAMHAASSKKEKP